MADAQSQQMDKQQMNEPSAPSTPWAGDDERPTQDNGTFGHTSYQMGNPSGNSFPAMLPQISDENYPNSAASQSADVITNYGIVDDQSENEPSSGNIAQYGIDGPSAGGGIDRNTGHKSGKT